MLKMTVEKVLWLLVLFISTVFAHNSTCSDLSWKTKAKQEKLTLYNAGDHILVLNSMRFECFGDDMKFEYTNKSILLNPRQSVRFPSDPWMSKCSVTFCSACLIHQCNIVTQFDPNAALVFLYNDFNLGGISAVEYAHQSRVFTKRYDQELIRATSVCPSEMVSVWTKNGVPTALIDIPNKKKVKTRYTMRVTCNGLYLSDDYGKAMKSFNYTTQKMMPRADVNFLVPLQELGEFSRNCTLDACLHKQRSCNQKIFCIFTIPDNNSALENVDKWKKVRYKTVSCSQTQWTWSPIDQKTGNLNLELRNKDWYEKSYVISIHCKTLRTMKDSLLIKIRPMVHAKFVSFPLETLPLNDNNDSATCKIKLCNTAKQQCGKNTKCELKIPMENGKFITTPLKNGSFPYIEDSNVDNQTDGDVKTKNNKTDSNLFAYNNNTGGNVTYNNKTDSNVFTYNNNTGGNKTDDINDSCESKSVIWTRQGPRRGIVSVQLLNSRQVTVVTQVSLACSDLEALKNEWTSTVVVPANSLRAVDFKLRPKSSIRNNAVDTYCTAKICNAGDVECNDNGQFCGFDVRVPLKDGLFSERDSITGNFEPKSITWLREGNQHGKVSIQLQNSKWSTVIATVSVLCPELEVLQDKWNLTIVVPANSLRVVEFKLRPKITNSSSVETNCNINICSTGNCETQKESHSIKIPFKHGLFPEEGNTTDIFESKSVIWSREGKRRGTVSVQLQNSKQSTVIARVSVNCSELEVLQDKWNLTIIVPANSLHVAEFKLRPKRSANSLSADTNCRVDICNMEDCENQKESHNIKIPLKHGFFPEEGNTTSELQSRSVTWSRKGTRRGIVSVKLRNSGQGPVFATVTVTCSGLQVVKDKWNLTVEVPASTEDVAVFKLRPSSSIDDTATETNCSVKICNVEDCDKQRESHVITIPLENGLFPKSISRRSLNYERNVIPSCSSDVLFSNVSSSDMLTVYVTVLNSKKNPLSYNVEINCSNIQIMQDNGTLSRSVVKTIPNIEPREHEVVQFRFQEYSTENSCTLDTCVQRRLRCASEALCRFTLINDTTSNCIYETCDRLKWMWNVHELNSGVFDIVLQKRNLDMPVLFNVTLDCKNLKVSNSSVAVTLTQMAYNKTINFTIVPFSLRQSATTTKCTITMYKDDCSNILVCNAMIPVLNQQFVVPQGMFNTASTPANSSSTNDSMPGEHDTHHRVCQQKDAVWEAEKPYRGILKVKVYNQKTEEIEFKLNLDCSNNLKAVNDKISGQITVPGKSYRPIKFRFLPREETDNSDIEEGHCVISICPHHNCTAKMKETCILIIPMNDYGFVPVRPFKKKDNETTFIPHACDGRRFDKKIHSHAPCHDKMWNLGYTSEQLEGEALLTVTLNLRPNSQADLQTTVFIKCTGIIIEDDERKSFILSKFEKQRDISFAFATIRSLHLERHICSLAIQHSLLVPSNENLTDSEIKKMCIKGEQCSIAIDSRLGRIIPKCNLNQVKSLINDTKSDQKSAKLYINVLPSVYNVFTYEAHCSKNNPFTYDSVNEKKKNMFVSESKETKLVTVNFAPDCDNDTIRKEFENYRKDDCNFFLYGYCQGGELLLEKLTNIPFDNDRMYCTPKLLFNRWLQNIQKETGIHSKPLAAILVIFIVIAVLLLVFVIPMICVVYFCCCRRHRDDAKRPSIGIVISSCDEWEEQNAMFKAMSEANSQFLMGRSDQKLPDNIYDSFDSMSDHDFESPIYQLDDGPVDQNDPVDRINSATYHDSEDHHHHHKHDADQHNPVDLYSAVDQHASPELYATIKQLEIEANNQLDVTNEGLLEEQYSKQSATRTDFSSSLDGWGDEYEGTKELL